MFLVNIAYWHELHLTGSPTVVDPDDYRLCE